jgi:hypothetical protein
VRARVSCRVGRVSIAGLLTSEFFSVLNCTLHKLDATQPSPCGLSSSMSLRSVRTPAAQKERLRGETRETPGSCGAAGVSRVENALLAIIPMHERMGTHTHTHHTHTHTHTSQIRERGAQKEACDRDGGGKQSMRANCWCGSVRAFGGQGRISLSFSSSSSWTSRLHPHRCRPIPAPGCRPPTQLPLRRALPLQPHLQS